MQDTYYTRRRGDRTVDPSTTTVTPSTDSARKLLTVFEDQKESNRTKTLTNVINQLTQNFFDVNDAIVELREIENVKKFLRT
jgi:hypothetical protein